MTDLNLTEDDLKLIAETTPEQWAETATEVFKDRAFLQELGGLILNGFVEGFVDAMNND